MMQFNQLGNRAFTKYVKTDPKDRLEVELGDVKQPNFFPQLKIKRWDNEVNASFRLKDFDNYSVSSEGEKVKLIGAKKEIHLYDVLPCKEHLEGGFEFEVILKEKPESNILEFSIETKGLDFFYQPELTQKEIEEGSFRPENVVGSYAVYHKTKGGLNVAGGKEYKVGKAFHIFRPKIIDAEGNRCWGELHIDDKNKLQTITIPQEFLDKAVYPIKHATGETFGYTSEGGSNTVTNTGVWIFGFKGTLSEAGTVTAVKVYLQQYLSNTPDVTTAIYNDSDGFEAEDTGSVTVNNATAAWLSWDFGDALTAGDYFLMFWGDDTYRYFYDTEESSGLGKTKAFGMSYDTWPDPLCAVGCGSDDDKRSIYAVYTPSAAGIASQRLLVGHGI